MKLIMPAFKVWFYTSSESFSVNNLSTLPNPQNYQKLQDTIVTPTLSTDEEMC